MQRSPSHLEAFAAKVEMLEVVTVHDAGEVTRRDVYMIGEQYSDAMARASAAA